MCFTIGRRKQFDRLLPRCSKIQETTRLTWGRVHIVGSTIPIVTCVRDDCRQDEITKKKAGGIY